MHVDVGCSAIGGLDANSYRRTENLPRAYALIITSTNAPALLRKSKKLLIKTGKIHRRPSTGQPRVSTFMYTNASLGVAQHLGTPKFAQAAHQEI
jgi:hypothetical protein